MTRAAAVPVVALVAHARNVPALEREQFAIALDSDMAAGALVLKTCHRVEAYLGDANEAARLAPKLPAGGRALTVVGRPPVGVVTAVRDPAEGAGHGERDEEQKQQKYHDG